LVQPNYRRAAIILHYMHVLRMRTLELHINWERRNLYIFWEIKEEGGSRDAPNVIPELLFKIMENKSEVGPCLPFSFLNVCIEEGQGF
jgi:hypothetical protein